MSPKLRRKVKKSCARKVRFASSEAAWQAARPAYRGRQRQFNNAGLSVTPKFARPYKCPVCTYWHIGTSSRYA